MPPPEVGTRRAVGDRLPDQLAGVGVGAQQPHDVARHLADVVLVDRRCRRLASSCGRSSSGCRLDERDADRAVVGDVDGVRAHVLLAEHAAAVADAELPVVPRTGEQLAVELAGRQAVALVRAGVVEGVDAGRGVDHAQPAPVDLDQLHRADRELGEVADDHGWPGRRAGTSMLTSGTVRLQVSLKSSEPTRHVQAFRSPAVHDRRDRAPGRRRHIGAALLRDRGADPLRAQRRRATAATTPTSCAGSASSAPPSSSA